MSLHRGPKEQVGQIEQVLCDQAQRHLQALELREKSGVAQVTMGKSLLSPLVQLQFLA